MQPRQTAAKSRSAFQVRRSESEGEGGSCLRAKTAVPFSASTDGALLGADARGRSGGVAVADHGRGVHEARHAAAAAARTAAPIYAAGSGLAPSKNRGPMKTTCGTPGPYERINAFLPVSGHIRAGTDAITTARYPISKGSGHS